MTIAELQRELQDRNLAEVSRQTGIAWSTLDDLKKGKRQDMHLSTWQTLSRYFSRGSSDESEAT